MLIRWANERDTSAWQELATELSPVFLHPTNMGKDAEFSAYAKSKVNNYEAITAIDYMSGIAMGFIGFSRAHNRVSWLGVSETHRGKGAANRLLKTALHQLDNARLVTVDTFPDSYEPGIPARALYRKFGFTEIESGLTGPFNLPVCRMSVDLSAEKRGHSFHYRYPEFIKSAQAEFCPACNGKPSPKGQNPIEINNKVWIVAEHPGQGRLFGKMYVMPRHHAFHFEDMPAEAAAEFMNEVQRVGRALRKVTGAEKINYEMHSNTGAHLHIHLFPRYLDDDFPGAPIQYHLTEPAPYESYDEYLWFIEQMRKSLSDNSIQERAQNV